MVHADIHDLSRRLSRHAEAVCRHYLPNGCRKGRYWLVGDLANTPGRSLFVRLSGPDEGKGAAGRWTDAATGDHGDLLDLIRRSCGLSDFTDALHEARRFLGVDATPSSSRFNPASSLANSRDIALRLFAAARPIAGTISETYLRQRGITVLHQAGNLRFHSRCYYRANNDAPPANLARPDRGGHQRRRPAHRRAAHLDCA